MEVATCTCTGSPMLHKLRWSSPQVCERAHPCFTNSDNVRWDSSQVHSRAHASGADPKISERGAGIRLFSAAFSHFLINLLQIFQQKGGGAARPAPPLNLRLRMLHKLRWNSPEVRARFHPGFTNSDGVRHKYAQGRTYASESQMEVVTSMRTKRVLQ